MVKERLLTLAWRIHNDLSSEDFNFSTELMVEHCRVVCDLKLLLLRIHEKGALIGRFEESSKLIVSALAIITTISSINNNNRTESYRDFLMIMEKTIRNRNTSELDNKDIINRSRNMKEKFTSDCIILHCISNACVKIFVESVVESLVSCYVNNFSPGRQPSKNTSLHEMIIAENGPLLQCADDILIKAMNHYWKVKNDNGKWHFVRNT